MSKLTRSKLNSRMGNYFFVGWITAAAALWIFEELWPESDDGFAWEVFAVQVLFFVGMFGVGRVLAAVLYGIDR